MSEPMLRIHNRHSVFCGDPPIVDNTDPDLYVGYFENRYGEQWIFTFDRKSNTAELRSGDTMWNTRFEVHDGHVPDLILNSEEQLWLQSCWRAVMG